VVDPQVIYNEFKYMEKARQEGTLSGLVFAPIVEMLDGKPVREVEEEETEEEEGEGDWWGW